LATPALRRTVRTGHEAVATTAAASCPGTTAPHPCARECRARVCQLPGSSFFTNGYNYLIQIIPALIVAPLFIRGEVEFGVITQSAMAFSVLLGALSLVVTQFQSISSFAAVIARLGSLW
jgi:hypothetical protein